MVLEKAAWNLFFTIDFRLSIFYYRFPLFLCQKPFCISPIFLWNHSDISLLVFIRTTFFPDLWADDQLFRELRKHFKWGIVTVSLISWDINLIRGGLISLIWQAHNYVRNQMNQSRYKRDGLAFPYKNHYLNRFNFTL